MISQSSWQFPVGEPRRVRGRAGNCRMISVLLEMKNGEGLSEAVSARIRQAFEVFLPVSSRKEID